MWFATDQVNFTTPIHCVISLFRAHYCGSASDRTRAASARGRRGAGAAAASPWPAPAARAGSPRPRHTSTSQTCAPRRSSPAAQHTVSHKTHILRLT